LCIIYLNIMYILEFFVVCDRIATTVRDKYSCASNLLKEDILKGSIIKLPTFWHSFHISSA